MTGFVNVRHRFFTMRTGDKLSFQHLGPFPDQHLPFFRFRTNIFLGGKNRTTGFAHLVCDNTDQYPTCLQSLFFANLDQEGQVLIR